MKDQVRIITRFLLINVGIFVVGLLLASCGFQLQGKVQLAPPLHRLYLQTSNPYGQLAKSLRAYFNMSEVVLTTTPLDAHTILMILDDRSSDQLLSVTSTQQTRQYNLMVTVVFQITDAKGEIILPPQSLSETRTITIQSNQILGNSNEANLYYQQMRRTLAYAIMNRIASRDVTDLIIRAFAKTDQTQ